MPYAPMNGSLIASNFSFYFCPLLLLLLFSGGYMPPSKMSVYFSLDHRIIPSLCKALVIIFVHNISIVFQSPAFPFGYSLLHSCSLLSLIISLWKISICPYFMPGHSCLKLLLVGFLMIYLFLLLSVLLLMQLLTSSIYQ